MSKETPQSGKDLTGSHREKLPTSAKIVDATFIRALRGFVEQQRRLSETGLDQEPLYPTDPEEEERRLNARLIDPVYQVLKKRYDDPTTPGHEKVELDSQLSQRLWELMISPTVNFHKNL